MKIPEACNTIFMTCLAIPRIDDYDREQGCKL
jgi:hypothetical protein